MTTKQSPRREPGASGAFTGAAPIVPSGLAVDGPRPAVAWASSLPQSWTTTSERLVLYVLACDAYGVISAPGRDNLRQWTGMWQDAVGKTLRTLGTATAKRPALIERQDADGRALPPDERNHGRHRTRYRLLVEILPDQPVGESRPVESPIQPDGESRRVAAPQPDGTTGRVNRTGQPDGESRSTPFPALPSNSSPHETTEGAPRFDDDASSQERATARRPLPPWREIAKAGRDAGFEHLGSLLDPTVKP